MSTDDYQLLFLEQLGTSFTDDDVEHLWKDRHFPLVHTEDFDQNWTAVPDDGGMFVMPSGSKCRVEPQAHYLSQCKITIREEGISREEAFSYEAIVFSHVVNQLWLSRVAVDKTAVLHAQVRRRRFIQQFVRKLPRTWRNIILYQHDIFGVPNLSKKDHTINVGIHSPLSHPRHIRLISLQPSVRSYVPITCTMFEADPAEGLEYEALSYVWGSPSTPLPIQVNGSPFLVTENLEAALRQFRLRGTTPRILWIDAICINQSDIGERTQQVQQMDAVYRGARGVLVWLGRESNTSARLFDYFDQATVMTKKAPILLTSLAMLRFPFEPEPYCADCGKSDPLLSAEQIKAMQLEGKDKEALMTRKNWLHPPDYESKHIKVELLEDLIQLLRRPWWRRIWVLQEVILAKHVTVHCGPRSVSWEVLQFCLYTHVRQARRARVHHQGGLSHDSRQASAQTWLLVLAKSTFPFFFLQQSSLLVKAEDVVEERTIVNLLSLSWGLEATDARDRLFAVVGLLREDSSDRLSFKPDYSLKTRQLFLQTAKHFLLSSQSLAIMTARPAQPGTLTADQDINELPTWAPDWTKPQLWFLGSIWVSELSEFHTLNMYMPKSRLRRHQHQHLQDMATAEASHDPFTHDEATPNDETTSNEASPIRLQVYNASIFPKSPFPFTFTTWDESLHVCGIAVDVIDQVGPALDLATAALQHHQPGRPYESQLGAAQAQMDIVHRWKTVARIHDAGDYPFARQTQTRLEAFWRTIFLDRYRLILANGANTIRRFPPPQKAQESDDGGSDEEFDFQVVRCRFPPRTEDEENTMMWYLRHEVIETWSFASLNLHSANLRFFRTANGYIGVAHPNAAPGDQVTVLPGSPVPLILREYPEGHVFIGQRFALPSTSKPKKKRIKKKKKKKTIIIRFGRRRRLT